jgi:hypothetical protein
MQSRCSSAAAGRKGTLMLTTSIAHTLTDLFSELVDGAREPGGAFMLNSGDIGLLRSLDTLSPAAASRSVNGGATPAAHAQMQALGSPRDVSEVELAGMIASIAHLAYHLGAIRQIDRDLRGPREGTF